MAEYKFPSDDAARDDDDGGGDDDNRTDYERAIDDIYNGAAALADIAATKSRDLAARLLARTADIFDETAATFRAAADAYNQPEEAADDGVNDG